MIFFSCAAMGRARFMFYTLFIFIVIFKIFFHFVSDLTQTSSRPHFESRNLLCLFVKSCWNINSRTVLRILFSLLCVKYIFFWLYWSVGFEGNNKCAKKRYYVSHACADVASFTFTAWQIRSCLLCKFISPGVSLFSFPSIFRIFRQEKWIVEQVQRSEGKLNICKSSKKHVRTCKDYVIGREITTVLKIAVDNVILELCDLCDFFASPLLKEKKQLNLIVTFKKESCC